MHATNALRRIEFALWFVGAALLGIAFAATFARWNYQVQQERALFEGGGPAISLPAPAPVSTPAPAPVMPGISQSTEIYGPPAPASPKPKAKPRPPALDPTAIARIEIPRLGVRAIVREGADAKTLSRAVGLVPGTAYPGEAGNMVLAAHRDTFFRPLRRIKVKDRIRLVAPTHVYEYEVQSLRVVEPHETEVLQSRGTEELTLVTCYPFRFVGPAPDRFIVTAKRVGL
jgi:sortase A